MMKSLRKKYQILWTSNTCVTTTVCPYEAVENKTVKRAWRAGILSDAVCLFKRKVIGLDTVVWQLVTEIPNTTVVMAIYELVVDLLHV